MKKTVLTLIAMTIMTSVAASAAGTEVVVSCRNENDKRVIVLADYVRLQEGTLKAFKRSQSGDVVVLDSKGSCIVEGQIQHQSLTN